MNIKLLVGALAFAAFTTPVVAQKASVYSSNIIEAEVLAAQQAWGDALIAINRAFDRDGQSAAAKLAEQVIDDAYGYNLGPVLFKPTLAEPPQNFRTSRDGALAYFVGDDDDFPNDSGFALKGWTKVEVRNAGIHINGDVASTLGSVSFTNKDGTITTVDKTWTFKKTDDGKLRIVVHHSSLPYSS
jgi:hypothetical protein